jgi:hypothetical protein
MEMFKPFFEKMSEKGLMRNDVEPEVIFRSILGNIGGIIAQRMLFSDKFPMNDLDKEADKTIDVLLNGIAGQKR